MSLPSRIAEWKLWRPGEWTRKGGAESAAFAFNICAIGSAIGAGLADQDHKPIFVVSGGLFALLMLVSNTLAKYFEHCAKGTAAEANRKRCVKVVEQILAIMYENKFATEDPADSHKNRITLFVCKESDPERADLGLHLSIFARHGTYPVSKTVWKLDVNGPDGCRGAAGAAWYHKAAFIVTSPTEWPADGDPVRQQQYASSQKITAEEAASLNVKSQSIIAAPVDVNGNRRWGVLVMDSLSSDVFPTDPGIQKKYKGMFNYYANLIGRVLSECEK